MDDEILIHKVTGNEIYKHMKSMDVSLKNISIQTEKTNGRVTELEKRSIGMWIRNHPMKFTAFVLFMLMFLVQETRSFATSTIMKLFGLL